MGVSRLYRVGTAYNGSELADLDYEQSADTMYLAHIDHPLEKLLRYSHTNWQFASVAFGPVIVAPSGISASPTIANTDAPNDGDNYFPLSASYVVSAINDVSGQVSRASSSASATNDLSLKGNLNTISWTASAGATRYAIYKQENGTNSYGYIGTSNNTMFIDNLGGVAPDYTDTPPLGQNPLNGAGNYPSTLTFHQQRLVLARTRNKPNGIYMSQTADYENLDIARPTKPDDAITYALAATKVNAVNQLASLANALVAFTGNALFTITGSAGPKDPITPTSISALPDVSRGAGRLKPITIDNVAFYPTIKGNYIRTLGYSFEIDGEKSDNISIYSPHFFKNHTVVSWAYCEHPFSVIWAVRDDGELLCFTWEAEQQVWGWTLCQTDGFIESVTSNYEDGEDRLYLSVKRIVEGRTVRFIERMASSQWTDIEDACYLDCAITQSFSPPATTISGLDHLEGRTVSALADGGVETGHVVANGTITLQFAASTVTVGLPYVAEVETLPLIFSGQEGSSVAKRQLVGAAVFSFVQSRGMMIGPDADNLYAPKPREYEVIGEPNDLLTGYVEAEMSGVWRDYSSAFIRQEQPLPMCLTGCFLEPVVTSTR